MGIIDTSGRTRSIKERSTIALASNQIEFTLTFEANIKKQIFELYKNQYSKEKFFNLLHSIGIYFILKDYIDILSGIFICADGFNPGKIKHNLGNLFKNKIFLSKIYIFSSLKPLLGKKNSADRLAYNVNKHIRIPTKLFQINDFKKLKNK